MKDLDQDEGTQAEQAVAVEFGAVNVRGQRVLREGASAAARPDRFPPRVAYHLAFAIRLAEDLQAGLYDDMADAARELGVTKARVSQLVDLTLLAPDIQEEILAMRIPAGRTVFNERTLRPIAALADWNSQRVRWVEIRRSVNDHHEP